MTAVQMNRRLQNGARMGSQREALCAAPTHRPMHVASVGIDSEKLAHGSTSIM
jgi:hypothetical protein